MRTSKEQLIATLEEELRIAKTIPDNAKLISLMFQSDPDNVILFHTKEDFYETFYSNDPDIIDEEIESVDPDSYMEFEYDSYWKERDLGGLNFNEYIKDNNVKDITVMRFM